MRNARNALAWGFSTGLYLQATCSDPYNDKGFMTTPSTEGTLVAPDYFSLSWTSVAAMTTAVILGYHGPHALRLLARGCGNHNQHQHEAINDLCHKPGIPKRKMFVNIEDAGFNP